MERTLITLSVVCFVSGTAETDKIIHPNRWKEECCRNGTFDKK